MWEVDLNKDYSSRVLFNICLGWDEDLSIYNSHSWSLMFHPPCSIDVNFL